MLLFQKAFSFLQIESISPRWCVALAENPLGCALAWNLPVEQTLQHCRMVWEDYFTSGTNPKSIKVGYVTTELISRVLDSKP